MKLYLIAGEASGDLHGSNLIRELKKQSPGIELRCWGGDLMQSAGAELVKHYRDLAFMGFVEVIMNIRTIAGNLRFCKKDIEKFQPDGIVLIDYPGFNMRIAGWAKSKGIKVFYYISPQIWAWKQGRVHKIRATVDEMFVVLPFEKEFYSRFNYPVHFVGHPLLDAVPEHQRENFNTFRDQNNLQDKTIIALLPGSRKQEIKSMLPLMLSVVSDFPEFQFVIAGAPGQDAAFYREITRNLNRDIPVLFGKTYSLLSHAVAGLVTSGTATLEAGIFGMPQVVCYKGSAISYRIAKRLIKVKYISLVNLILDRKAVTELIQNDLNHSSIRSELYALIYDLDRKNQMIRDYDELHSMLGGQGASRNTASLVLKSLES